MVDGVRNCGGGPCGRNFADTHDAYGIEAWIGFVDKFNPMPNSKA